MLFSLCRQRLIVHDTTSKNSLDAVALRRRLRSVCTKIEAKDAAIGRPEQADSQTPGRMVPERDGTAARRNGTYLSMIGRFCSRNRP
jgi:hypothetical protein